MNLALVYDRTNKLGGAERVLKALHEIYPKAPLYTAVYNPQKAGWTKGWDVRVSFLNRLPLARSTHELYPWLTPMAFESLDFSDFDIVISVTSADAKGILTKPSTLHVCYVLTPTRYLWSDRELYQKEIPRILRPLTKPIFSYLTNWDKIASQRPDFLVAISKAVQTRIKTYYNREADVIYPPVEVEAFGKRKEGTISVRDYFLVVSRLVPHKRLDLAIQAANALRLPLVIVGTGLQAGKLNRIAGPTVTFVGQLTDEKLVLYYQKCRALIFPQEEGFGLSVVEAQAAGKPVIAYNGGGATEIIRAGKTGIFFSQQKVESLVNALKGFRESAFDPTACKQNAKRFDKKRFINEFGGKIGELWKKHQDILK